MKKKYIDITTKEVIDYILKEIKFGKKNLKGYGVMVGTSKELYEAGEFGIYIEDEDNGFEKSFSVRVLDMDEI